MHPTANTLRLYYDVTAILISVYVFFLFFVSCKLVFTVAHKSYFVRTT